MFFLNRTSGELWLAEALDREEVHQIDLVLKASQDCGSGRWELDENMDVEYNSSDLSLLWVQVIVLDINDNAPKFTKKWFTAGVTRDTQFDEPVIDLAVRKQLSIIDL